MQRCLYFYFNFYINLNFYLQIERSLYAGRSLEAFRQLLHLIMLQVSFCELNLVQAYPTNFSNDTNVTLTLHHGLIIQVQDPCWDYALT